MDQTAVKWDLQAVPTARLLDLLHEYAGAHAAVSDPQFYAHPDQAHHQAHWYNMRWAVARELEKRGYKDHLLPLVTKSLADTQHLRLDRPPLDMEYLQARGLLSGPCEVQGRTMVYTLHKSMLGPGERWITVHPHGDNEPGIPVLIQERPDGTAHVIGGAGGSLNYVHLTNLKSPEQWRAKAREQAKKKRQQEVERKAKMSPGERAADRAAQAKIEDDKRKTQDEAVAQVYEMLGQSPPQPQDPLTLAKETGVTEQAARMALARERQAHLTAVKKLAAAVREQMLDDHELAAAAGLGDISLAGAADADLWGEGRVSMDLLQPDRPNEASGIKTDFKPRAEAQANGGGASDGGKAERQGEAAVVKVRAKPDQEQRQFSERISQNLKDWNAQAKELENTGKVKQNILKVDQLPETDKLLPILKADQAIKEAEKAAREANSGQRRGLQSKPLVVDTSIPVEATLVKQMVNEVELKTTRAMLSRVANEEGLTKHVRNAAFDTLNQVALTLSGEELLSRELVDFLGSAGAAQLLAQRLRQTLGDADYAAVQAAVAEMHGRDNAAQAQAAMDAADVELEMAKAIQTGETAEPQDVLAARVLNEKRLDHLQAARQTLGDAYGRLQAMGELSFALRDATKAPRDLRVDLADTPREQAILMARSFGLTPEIGTEEAETAGTTPAAVGGDATGDYRLEAHSGRTFVTLKPGALEKVVHAFDPADTQAYAAATAIKQGAQDEDGWLPAGIERRPASTFNDPGYTPARFDTRLAVTPHMSEASLKTAVQDYIGAKMGEGYPYDQLIADMQSPEFRGGGREPGTVPPEQQAAYDRILAEEFPGVPKGEMSTKEHFAAKTALKAAGEARAQQYSADYKRRRGMTDGDLIALNTQRLAVHEALPQFNEAAHRTLAQMPEAKVAFTPMGELDRSAKATLRDFFQQEMAAKPKSAAEQAQAAAPAPPPRKENAPVAETGDLFAAEGVDVGEGGVQIHDAATQAKLKAAGTSAETIQAENREGVKQQQQADRLAAGEAEAPETRTPEQQAWDNYVSAHGSEQDAYESLQAVIKGRTVDAFAQHYGRVFGRPLKVGQVPLPHGENHVLGQMSPDKLKAVMGDRAKEAQEQMAHLASRSGGKFSREQSEGARREAYENLKQMQAQSQGKLFVGEQFPTADRPSIGKDAEAQLASVWGNAAQQFSPKQGGLQLVPDLSMSGDKIKQQRAVKLAIANQRLGLHMGAGSGKTVTAIGTFTELHQQKKVKKAVFAVPSAVQAQFGSDLNRFTTPGKYQWLADPKATREQRMAAYADDSTHMIVATHQAFRDDLLHAVADHADQSFEAVRGAFAKLSPEGRRAAMKAAMQHMGWKVDFLGVDEAHGILNRQGKPDSSAAAAIDACSYHMPHYLSMTGTPVKNDASEAFDVLAKLHPQRFKDRASFVRKYGVNTPTNHAALQRLMGRYVYSDQITSGVNQTNDLRHLDLHPAQQKEYDGVRRALNQVRRTRKSGKTDIDAMKTISPAAFEGQPEAKHQEIANELAHVGVGGRVQARLLAVVNGTSYEHNAKIDALREDLTRDKAIPHVIFAHHYQSVAHVQRLCGELGIKAGVISGKMSAAEKAKVRLGFQPEDGSEPKYDVLINTDAGSTGQNLQRGQILVHYDTPDTAMTHAQRNARVNRIGQQSDVQMRDYVTNTPIEMKARKRLATKYALADVFQSPSELLDDTGLADEIQRVKAAKQDQPEAQPMAMKATGTDGPVRPSAARAPASAATPEPTEAEKQATREQLQQRKRLERAKRGPKKIAMGYGSIDGDRAHVLTGTPEEARESFEQRTAQIKESAKKDREHQESQETPRQKALREHQIATTQRESLQAAHADSLAGMDAERQRTGSVSPESQEAHRQLQQRLVDADGRVKSTQQAQVAHYPAMNAERQKDKAKAQRQESQARKKTTEESNLNHFMQQAREQGKVTEATEPEVRQIAAAVGKVNPKGDRMRHLSHAIAFGSLAGLKQRAADASDPDMATYAQSVLEKLGKMKPVQKGLRLMVRA